jgi:hypothetical protein
MAVSMRSAYFFLFFAVCLPLGACGSKGGSKAPPVPDRNLLQCAWQAYETDQLFQSMEFKPDQTFSLRVRDVPEAISGKYAWSGDYSLHLDYQPSAEAQKAYRAVVKGMKDTMEVAGKKMGGNIGDNILKSAARYVDELPAGEEMRVALSESYGGNLSLTTEKGLVYTFKKSQ